MRFIKLIFKLNVKIYLFLRLWFCNRKFILEVGGIRRLGSLMCLGCGWWVDIVRFLIVMLGSCKSLFIVEVLFLGADFRSFIWEGKDFNLGGGIAIVWVWCCCRWFSWLRIGDGLGWDLKFMKYVIGEKGKKVSNN